MVESIANWTEVVWGLKIVPLPVVYDPTPAVGAIADHVPSSFKKVPAVALVASGT